PSGARYDGSCQDARERVNRWTGLVNGWAAMVRWIGGSMRHSPRITGTGAVGAGSLRRQGHIAGSPPSLAGPGVDPGDLGGVPEPVGVFQVEDLVQRPMEVVSEVRDLLVQPVGRVRHDSPRRPPARSMSNPLPHLGQVTAARVCPSLLIRRYRSWRNAR